MRCCYGLSNPPPPGPLIWYQMSWSQRKKASCQINCITAAAADSALICKYIYKAHSFFHLQQPTFLFKLVLETRWAACSQSLFGNNPDVIFTTKPQWKQTSHIHSVWAPSPAMHRDTPTLLLHTDSARSQQFDAIKSIHLRTASSFLLHALVTLSIIALKIISNRCCGI